MDDFILVSESKEQLIEAKEYIEAYLTGIDLELNNKTVLQKIKHGIMYLHWKYKITDAGKVLMQDAARMLVATVEMTQKRILWTR